MKYSSELGSFAKVLCLIIKFILFLAHQTSAFPHCIRLLRESNAPGQRPHELEEQVLQGLQPSQGQAQLDRGGGNGVEVRPEVWKIVLL